MEPRPPLPPPLPVPSPSPAVSIGDFNFSLSLPMSPASPLVAARSTRRRCRGRIIPSKSLAAPFFMARIWVKGGHNRGEVARVITHNIHT